MQICKTTIAFSTITKKGIIFKEQKMALTAKSPKTQIIDPPKSSKWEIQHITQQISVQTQEFV